MSVVVLGAGVVGTASAWYLARAGHEVALVDRREGPGLETSFANGGQVSVCHAEPWAGPGAPARILRWLARDDAPLLFRPRLDPQQWSWGLRFLFECLAWRARANTAQILALAFHRPVFVRNLLNIIVQWNNPRLADSVEKIIRYPDPLIRREVIRTLSLLRPSGSAAKIVPLLNDADEAVRLAALKPLLTGQYTAPFPIWEPIVTADTFGDRPPAERRNIFHAMRATAGDEAVPFWTTLLTEWGWTNRKKREELALIAVDALGKLGTQAAQAALHTGTQKGTAAVKQACTTALTNLAKQAPKS